jgi:hypothetical protein
LAAKLASGMDNRRIAVAPIVSVAGQHPHLSSLKQHLAAIAIVFDFMNPVLAVWRLIGRRSKLRRDKGKAGNAGHAYLSSKVVGNYESHGRWQEVLPGFPRYLQLQSFGGEEPTTDCHFSLMRLHKTGAPR